jgi:peptidoglycan/xylan/chitin deacetylase (PgdA/CDA1 family)
MHQTAGQTPGGAASAGKSTATLAPTDKYWEQAREGVYRSTAEVLKQHEAELAQGVAGHTLARGDKSKKELALTFDDGPHPDYTPGLLKVLKDHGVKATFFVVGEMAEKYPDLIKAEVADGHLVGNHTYHHVNLTKIPETNVATEIAACDDVLKGITGESAHFFRPPGGDWNKPVVEAAEALGYTMVLWTDDPGDYASPGGYKIEVRTLDTATNGGIILLHDGVQETIDVLPQIIDTLKGKGFEFVTVGQMKARD